MVQKIQRQPGSSSICSAFQYPGQKIFSQKSRLTVLQFFIPFLLIFTACQHLPIEKKHPKFQKFQTQLVTQKTPSSNSTQAQKALLEGNKLYKQAKFELAQEAFEKAANIDKPTQAKAQFFLGSTLLKLKKFNQAFQALSQVPYSNGATPKWILKSLHLQWQTLHLQKSDDIEAKLYIQSQIIEYSSSMEKKQQAREVVSSLIQDLTTSKINNLIRNPDLLPIRDLFLFKKAKGLVKGKQFQKALSYFRELLNYISSNDILEKTTQQYIQALTVRTRVNKNTIGAILPLTGPHQKIGKRCLNGLQMGLGMYDTKPSKFKLAVADSKGNPNLVHESVKNLLLEHQAIGIIGGIVSQTALQLTKETQNFMIPAILLSQKSNLTKAGPYIFQNAVNSKHIVQALVNTLVDKLEHKKFAILYPNDPFGIEYANLFWDYVISKNKEVTGVQTYKPGETDFNDNIKRLTGTYYMEDRDEEYRTLLKQLFSTNKIPIKNHRIKNLLPPVVDFSVLFIPDSLKSLHLIAPYMSFHNIEGVTLVGPSLWNSSQLLKKNLKNIEGIIFADTLISNNDKFKTSSFFEIFHNTFGYKPGLFELLSYEAALAFREVITEGAHSREELRNHLSKMNQFLSPVGIVKISENREFIHPITVFSVKEEQIVPLNY